MNTEIKLEHFKNLVAIAAADGYMDAREREFLADRAEEIGLSAEKVQEIIEEANALEFIVPMNKFDREDQLSDAVFMSVIDGDISEREYQLCLSIAQRLGFEKSYLDAIVNSIRDLWNR
jgi:tellurite resistance protein